jgi:hypothetical protein
MADHGARNDHSGWLEFAIIWFCLSGILHAISGISALARPDYFHERDLLIRNLDVWGWTWLVLGLAQLVAGFLIYRRVDFGRKFGIGLALVSLAVWWVAFAAYPGWGLMMWIVDVGLLYALIAGREAFHRK